MWTECAKKTSPRKPSPRKQKPVSPQDTRTVVSRTISQATVLSSDRRPAPLSGASGFTVEPLRPVQAWETTPVPAHQVALQEEIVARSGVTLAEAERFQRLLTHLCHTRPGGGRELLRDRGLLPQSRPGSITERADGTHIHLPEGVLDFHQLRELFAQDKPEEEVRGNKGGPGKKSK